MELYQKQCKKKGLEGYIDLVLTFELDGVKREVLVRPCFWHEMDVLKKVAIKKD